MKGKRVYPDDKGVLWLNEGEYGQYKRGMWLARPPGAHAGNLSRHKVTEHEDGTITVAPSILITNGETGQGWHGYLERGVWRRI